MSERTPEEDAASERFFAAFIDNEKEFVDAWMRETGRPFEKLVFESLVMHIQALSLAVALGMLPLEELLALLTRDILQASLMLRGLSPGDDLSPDAPQPMTDEDEAIALELDELGRQS